MKSLIDYAENGQRPLPDSFIRIGIRYLCKKRLNEILEESLFQQQENKINLIKESCKGLIADVADSQLAKQQHYEVPTEFYQYSLGKHLKYSSALWHSSTTNLDQAEENMLEWYVLKADLKNGQRVLDLGCGWGSFSLWAAQKFPESSFVALSHSSTQRQFIEAQASLRGLKNLEVRTHNINDYQNSAEEFDRIVSVEMFEHLNNHRLLFQRVNQWLKPDGLLFFHVFCHKQFAYRFATKENDDWMGKYFFTGGLMPSSDYFLYHQQDLELVNQWNLSGKNYQLTARAWLENLDSNRKKIIDIFKDSYPNALLWLQRWRIFFMACEELFGYNDGNEWHLTHYLMRRRVHAQGNSA